MKKFKIFITATLLFLSCSAIFAQTATKVTKKDFQLFIGNWNGTLTYLDYSSNKPYTMPADIEIRHLKKSNVFIFSNLYPDEPKANLSDSLTISENGKMINKATVKSKRKLTNGNIKIVTELMSIDGNDNKPATIRVTYTVGKNIYTNIKDVQFVGQNKWIKRHEYSYTRK